MLTPEHIFIFLNKLDNFDKISIDENQNGEKVTLDDINSFNSGNNCLHFQIVQNNHRIVIQTYKYMNIPGRAIDIVQGKPEMEDDFIDFIEYLNDYRVDFTDQNLNKLFVLYCGLWQSCSAFYYGEMDSYVCEFGPDVQVVYDAEHNTWSIDADNASLTEIHFVVNFIDTIENFCK